MASVAKTSLARRPVMVCLAPLKVSSQERAVMSTLLTLQTILSAVTEIFLRVAHAALPDEKGRHGFPFVRRQQRRIQRDDASQRQRRGSAGSCRGSRCGGRRGGE